MALAQELRFAARMLAKNKGWTAVSALALALGLGANVAIFSVVGLMVWTPLPYPDADRLVNISQTNADRGFSNASVSYRDTQDWAAASSFASLAVYQSRPLAVSGAGEPQHLRAMQVSPEFFATVRVSPALGRAFTPAESPETESRSAIISHELWQGMFRGEAGVLGRDIRLDGRNYSIVGVMPAGFEWLYQRTDVWTPMQLEKAALDRGYRGMTCIARLKPGATVPQAHAEVRSISERIEREDPKNGLHWRGTVQLLTDRFMGRGARAAAHSMFGAVGFVLLIACANVASLLLARGTQRRRELALRASLGASRASLIRLQLIESLLLSAVGGVLGVVSAIWTIPLLKRIAPPEITVLQTAQLDWTALAYGLTLSVVTGVVFGVVPAWLLTRGDLARHLQEASRGSSGGRHFMLKSLVVGEIALALVLLAASTLMIRSLVRQFSSDPGFDRRNLTAAQVLLSTARYPEKQQAVDFFSSVLDHLRRDGSVESAALVQTIPLAGSDRYTTVHVEGDSDSRPGRSAGEMVVSPGYFAAMRIPLLAGRDFGASDTAKSQPVAIVNETFVKRNWPGVEDPLGHRVRFDAGKGEWVTIVGMARDVHHTHVMDPPRPEIYQPLAQTGPRSMTLVARGRTEASTAGALRAAVWQVDREQPLFRLMSMDAMLTNRSAGERATAQVLGFLAFVALVLAAVGTYGVVAYMVAQRMREIGIRLALGATQQDVFSLVLRGGLVLAGIGLAIGLPAAYGVTPLLASVASGLDRRDTMAYGTVAITLAVVAMGACLLPAWRAMRVDPATVLRDE